MRTLYYRKPTPITEKPLMQNESPNPHPESPSSAPLPVLVGNRSPQQSGLIDEGFCLEYFRLSYRRRFWRDITGAPIVILLLFTPLFRASNTERILLIALSVIVTIGMAYYNYHHWQKTKRESQPAS